MRTGTILAIVAAAIIVIGGFFWYSSTTNQAQLEQQRSEQAVQTARDQERQLQEEAAREDERQRLEQTAREEDRLRAQETAREQDRLSEDELARSDQAPQGDDQALAAETEAPSAGDAETPDAQVGALQQDTRSETDGRSSIVVGDEITEGAIVVESETSEPVVFDPENSASTVEIVDAAEPAGAVTEGGEGQTEAGGADGSDVPADALTTAGPDQLLTPENFDLGEVLALIDDSDQLTSEQRSTLSAVAEGASANPEMVDAAIDSIRTALNMPRLD